MMPFAFLGKIYTSVFSLLTVTGRAAIFNKAAKMKDWAFDSAKLFASWTIAHITAAAGTVMSAGVTEVILGVATVGAAAWGISKLLESDGEEEKADRKVALRLQEESLELQRAKEAKNESLNPLWKISNDIAQNVAMMNSLVDLAETRTDIAETQSAGLQFGNASPSMLGG
jgi:hypothetical protein